MLTQFGHKFMLTRLPSRVSKAKEVDAISKNQYFLTIEVSTLTIPGNFIKSYQCQFSIFEQIRMRHI